MSEALWLGSSKEDVDDPRSSRTHVIFLAIAATAADAVTFMLMVATVGPQAELNPLVRMAGPLPAVALKMALMVFLSAFAYIIYEKATRRVIERRRIMWLVLAIAMVTGVVGAVSNIRVLMT